jgi:hypothetical protein
LRIFGRLLLSAKFLFLFGSPGLRQTAIRGCPPPFKNSNRKPLFTG